MSVLVYAENWEGKFKKVTFELVSYASKIAEMTGGKVDVLSIGNVAESELAGLGKYGADRILKAEGPSYNVLDSQAFTSVVARAAEHTGAHTLVLSHNNTGKAIAPRLSVRLKASLGSAVVALPESADPFVVRKRVFNGNAYARVSLKTGTRILTLLQNSFEVLVNEKQPAVEAFQPDVPAEQFTTKVADVHRQTGKILLSDADIVVSGGRGMKGPENWQPIEELAELLHGATACSRPVSDEGWRPHEEHTGQTGKVIAPTLYIAVGISGAIQHVAGIRGSKCIVAINKDADAPIFEVADYGIVGDAFQVLPAFIEAVRELKS